MPDGWTAGDAFDAGAVELARLGLLLPAMVAIRLDVDDRTFRVPPRWPCDLAEGAAHAARLRTGGAFAGAAARRVGMTTFAVFRGGVAHQVAIIVGEPDLSAVVPVRVHSSPDRRPVRFAQVRLW